MRVENVSDPVYAPNSKGGPKADGERYPQLEVWGASGEFVHAAYTLRKDDDDWSQAGDLVRKVMNDAEHPSLIGMLARVVVVKRVIMELGGEEHAGMLA